MAFERLEDFQGAAILTLGVVFSFWESWRPARTISRRADWRRDALALVVLVVGLNVSGLLLNALFKATGLNAALAEAPWHGWPRWVQVGLAILLIDLSLYWLHRAMHTSALWATHKWHHSVEHMYWFSGMRTSLGHALIFAVPQVLFGFYVFHFAAYELGIVAILGVFIQYFVHSNLTVRLGLLEYVIVTPQSHRRHHARLDGVRHGNYATFFSFWDRLFGTYVDWRELPAEYPLGLPDRDNVARMAIGV